METVGADAVRADYAGHGIPVVKQFSEMISSLCRRAVDRLIVLVGQCYIRLVGLTTKVSWYGEENVPRGPFIYAFWHCRLCFFVYSHRNRNIHILVSKSRDGELIASTLQGFGFRTIRGSSSRSGSESARQMIRALRGNAVCGITPDGPRGPARQVKEGVTFIAYKSGYPIVPVSCSVGRRKFLNSWDRFMVPLPFSRAVIVTGKPIAVTTADELASAQTTIARALDRLTRAADSLVRAREFPGGA